MKASIAVILIIVVAIAGYTTYRSLSKPKANEQSVTEAQAAPETAPIPSHAATETKISTATAPVTTAARANLTAPKPASTKPQPTGEWKAKMDVIIASSANSQTKLQQMKELLSSLSQEEAEQAVQALATSVKDDGFAFLKPLVVDPTMPEAVRDEFMVDLMNRPNSIKVPLMLEIARNPDHPDHESAYDTLEAFTGLKYGADWTGWEKGIEQWLRENPDRVRKSQVPVEVN